MSADVQPCTGFGLFSQENFLRIGIYWRVDRRFISFYFLPSYGYYTLGLRPFYDFETFRWPLRTPSFVYIILLVR